ncbi:bifunctional 2-methylcitrate synthase/citrate synthase [Actinotalea sp. BY-33]|uniref:Citrate synthase n=1 Tax=Actinotalea soli TaxID=2819234 RepID=A0A939LV51_9CELL|nr:bifunctional 2-methylcitrate synthase/citrate synthase [Actinotalea soli]MBO1752689.1 bifunctional 2-methylcitrate synthase/citrate synthase [Actinotalea soli]
MTSTPTEPRPAAGEHRVARGLAGVVVDTTAVSHVDPASNSLLYRGYPVQELARDCAVEEVAWLLWHGELPDPAELEGLAHLERSERFLSPLVEATVDALPRSAHPMDVLRTAVSVIGSEDAGRDSSAEADLARSVRLFAQLPTVVARDRRRRLGLGPVPPRDDLDHAANLLWMTFGEAPDPVVHDAFQVSMVLYAEHSFNASTFTARVVTSTLSDLYSSVVAAIGALKGPLHGGANEAVMETLAEIGSAAGTEEWLERALGERRKIMGFGHRVYKHGDSRVPTMREALDRLVEHTGRQDLLERYEALERGMTARTGILPNLDYPAGPAYHLMGFETETFTPLFAVSRIMGWTAHVLEQRADNALIRPLSEYVGPGERHR